MDITAKLHGNIQQKVFDAIPNFPELISLDCICAVIPCDRMSIRAALRRLRTLRKVEFVRDGEASYRRREDATRPEDGRVGNMNARRNDV